MTLVHIQFELMTWQTVLVKRPHMTKLMNLSNHDLKISEVIQPLSKKKNGSFIKSRKERI
jgi:hypothetical protein